MNGIKRGQCETEMTKLFTTQINKLSAITLYLLDIKTAIAKNEIDRLQTLIQEKNIPLRP